MSSLDRNTSLNNGDSADMRSCELLKLDNPYLGEMSEDFLHHFALGTKTHNLPQMFGDVKFVVCGGSTNRMKWFADFIQKECKDYIEADQPIENLARGTDRFVMYKVGPILIANHGIGPASLIVMLNEVIKLLYHAKVRGGATIIRIGTSGGIGLPPGTCVVTKQGVDGLFRSDMEMFVLGEAVHRPSVLDIDLANELIACSERNDDFETVLAKTMCTNDFYEGQGRLDGAFCNYKEEDKMAFLKKCQDKGINNIEMECQVMGAMCHGSGIRGAVVCVTIVNRLEGDQIEASKELLGEWEQRPALILSRWIKKQLNNKK